MKSAHFLKAVKLRQLRRFEQAESELKLHLASEPDDADAHAELALCLKEEKRRLPEALAAIDRAVGLDPEESSFHSWRCFVLCQLDRGEDALAAAKAAVALDPGSAAAWVEMSRAYYVLECWKASEISAKRALSINPEHSVALNLMASTLQNQEKKAASVEVAERLLARYPDDAFAHANLGWAKLAQERYPEAESHFREALRLSPELEFARSGLVECFKARSPYYRLFLRWAVGVNRVPEGLGWFLWIGVYVWFRVKIGQMAPIHPLVVGVALALWLPVIFGRHLADGLGHAVILFDRRARMSLTSEERANGILVGSLVLSGMVAGVLGLSALPLSVAYGGLMMFAAAIPASFAMPNDRPTGRLLFGCVALVSLAGGFYQFYRAFAGVKSEMPGWLVVALFACALAPWMGNSSKLVKRP